MSVERFAAGCMLAAMLVWVSGFLLGLWFSRPKPREYGGSAMTRIILLAGAVLVLYHFTLSDRSLGMDRESLQLMYSAVASWL